MRLSGPAATAQGLARGWLLAAAASLFLPSSVRLGWWLPLHLALAGAAGTAVAGAMPRFAAALSGSRQAREDRLAPLLISAAAGSIAVGVPARLSWLTAIGGAAYAAGAVRLGVSVAQAWRSGRNRRHIVEIGFYVAATLALLAGAILGTLLGTGLVGASYAAVRRAHITLNLEGFLALTIAGTLLILLPVVLRVRAPEARGWGAFVGLAGGVALQAAGLLLDRTAVVAAGALFYAAGAGDLTRVALLTLRRRPRVPEPTPSLHLLAAVAWLLVAAVAQAVASLAGRIDSARDFLLVTLGLGVVVQALLGAWSYLLPVSATGGARVRRLRLARTREGAPTRAVAFNLGVGMAAAGSVTAGDAGGVLVLAGVTAGVAAGALLLARVSAAVPSGPGAA